MRSFKAIIIILVTFVIIAGVFLFIFKVFVRKEKETQQLGTTSAITKLQINWIGHWKNEGLREQLVREVARDYEFVNQNIKVNLKFPEDVYFKGKTGGEADNEEVKFIAEQVTTDTPQWDIIRIRDFYPKVATYLTDPNWGEKYLVDFSQFPDFRELHQGFVFDNEHKNVNGGITIGPYNEGFYFAMWYNKALADKIGIKVKQFGMTPDDLVSYVKAVNDYNKANGTDIIAMFEEANWIISVNIAKNMFYSLVDDYIEINNLNFNPKKLEYVEKILQVFEELSKYSPLPKDRSNINWSATLDYPLNEKCLLYPQGSWMYNIWLNIDKVKLKNMVPAELPSFTERNAAYIGGYKACWAVPKNSLHKDEAIKLLKFWALSDISEKWVQYTKCPTAVKGSISTATLGLDQFEDFQYYVSKKYGLHMLNPVDNIEYFGEKNKGVYVPIMEILEKKKTVVEAMKEIKRQIRL
jgi:ABC-type glycerol-3-phosphate transport system substrate-binding protein